MDRGTRVTVTTKAHGIVESCDADGVCIVRWDSGVVERIHESEMELEDAEYLVESMKQAEAQWPGE